jgi:hypothetical protein
MERPHKMFTIQDMAIKKQWEGTNTDGAGRKDATNRTVQSF